MQTEDTLIQEQPGYVPFGDAKQYQRPADTRDAELPRYPFFAGNVVEPEAARQRPYLKAGGIEIPNPCLKFVKSFLRKGRITPMLEDTFRPIPREKVDPQDKSYFDIVPPAGYQAPWPQQTAPIGPSSMMVKRVLPGEQIDLVLSGPESIHQMIPRGLAEIRVLKGQSYNPTNMGNGLYLDPKIWELQKAIFPDYPILPVSIFDLRKLLDAAWASEYLREIVEDMQTSSNQFEAYARATVEQAHLNMRTVASSVGYAPQYTPVDLVLLEQLGMQRRDPEFQQLAQMTGQGAGGNQAEMIREMFEMFKTNSREERDAIIESYERKLNVASVPGSEVPADEVSPADPPVIDETTMQAAPNEPLPNPVIKPEDLGQEFKCGGCGHLAKSLAGLKSHERACEAVKKE